MRCQDVERLILDKSEKEWKPEERRVLESHLKTCPDCAAFKDFREGVRAVLARASAPQMEPRRAEEVRLRSHAELRRQAIRRRAEVPWPIWTALGVLTMITLGFFIPQIQEFFATREFTPAVGFLSVIVLQNAVILFFAPVIMRNQSVGHNEWREDR
jgi:anti-sigma factor RsiW